MEGYFLFWCQGELPPNFGVNFTLTTVNTNPNQKDQTYSSSFKLLHPRIFITELEELAQKERVFDAWETALRTYLDAYEEFLDIGDKELALFCLSRAEQIERQRERPWERARFLQQVVALALA